METDFYALILWPYSQEFIGNSDCYWYSGNSDGDFDEELSQAIFVPGEILMKLPPATMEKIINGIDAKYCIHDIILQSSFEGLIGISYADEEEQSLFVQITD